MCAPIFWQQGLRFLSTPIWTNPSRHNVQSLERLSKQHVCAVRIGRNVIILVYGASSRTVKSGGAVIDYKTQTGLPNAFQNRVQTKLWIVLRNGLKLKVQYASYAATSSVKNCVATTDKNRWQLFVGKSCSIRQQLKKNSQWHQ